jgi:choline transport protein
MTLANFHHPEFVATQWQTYLLFALLMVIATCIVVYLPRQIPKAEMAFFFCTITGFFVFLISVLARSKTKQPASVVFTKYDNITGWDDGTAFILGVGTCMYVFLAADGATHISEEIPNPGRNVPRAILFTMIIGICTVFPWTLAFLFSTNDLEAVAASSLPILEVYHQALDSKAGATVFAFWLLWIYFGALFTCIATSGRLAWAFARDGGLPFSKHFAKVHPTLLVPANATLASGIFQILYGLIYIGSTTAFNSIISMAILSLNITYVIPQGIVLFRGRANVLPKRYFDLGPIFGPAANAFACLWVSLYTILFCFPLYMPAEVETMNYLSVVLAGILVFIAIHWFAMKRKTFTGPVSIPRAVTRNASR